MSSKEGARIFVGGLSWETTERALGSAFSRFGKVLDSQIMVERDTGRPRGFGFVTFADRRAMEDAISEMHNKELDGRQISVNKAEPKVGSDDTGYGYGGRGYSSGNRGVYRGADDLSPDGDSNCFKCGRSGHWARDCPSSGGGVGGRFSSRPRIGRGGGRGTGRGDRYKDQHMDDRYDGGRYGDKSSLDGRDSKYSGGRDRYVNDRYSPVGDRLSGSRYGSATDRYLHDRYNKERSFAAAPLLCAGITMFSPMKQNGMLNQPGKRLGIVGLGGLGHVGIKLGKAFGLHVTVISTSPSKKNEAQHRLGADNFILSSDCDQMEASRKSLDFIIDTVSGQHELGPLLELLKVGGTLVMVGVAEKPLPLPSFPLLFARRKVVGSLIGGMKETQEMLDLCGKHNITCDIETVKPEAINEAMERLGRNDVRYRFVIDIASAASSNGLD